MNICYVSQFYPPDTGGGGIAAYIYYMARAMRDRGHRVWIIARGNVERMIVRQEDGFEVWRLPPAPLPSRLSRLPLLGPRLRAVRDLWHALHVRRALLRLLEQNPLDIVEYADIDAEGFFHPRRGELPYVVKLHTPHFVLRPFYTRREQPYDARPVEWLERSFICKADGLTSPSCSLATIVGKAYNLPDGHIRYVPNPIDPEAFRPGENRTNSSPVILYPGRLEHLKGADLFARAIPLITRRVPEVCFIFLGADRWSPSGGSMRAELETYLVSQGVRGQVQFHAHTPPEVFRRFYQTAAICVIPSRFENCPYTVLEAMACARPTVVTDAFGMAEMVEHGVTGLRFRPNDPVALAEAVLHLLADPAWAAKMGKAARQRVVEWHNPERVALLAEQFYVSLTH